MQAAAPVCLAVDGDEMDAHVRVCMRAFIAVGNTGDMPQVVANVWVPVAPKTAFAVSQMTGESRLQWDPFIKEQYLIDADSPGKGITTYTRTRVGLRMVSEYSSFRPPVSVGMTMKKGPWFFSLFGGGWRFTPEVRDGVAGTAAVWKYTFTIRPVWLRAVANPIGKFVLGREIGARIRAFAKACSDPQVVAAVAESPASVPLRIQDGWPDPVPEGSVRRSESSIVLGNPGLGESD